MIEAKLLFTKDDGDSYSQSVGRLSVAMSDRNSVSVDVEDCSEGDVFEGANGGDICTIYLDSYAAWELSQELADAAREMAPDYSSLAA